MHSIEIPDGRLVILRQPVFQRVFDRGVAYSTRLVQEGAAMVYCNGLTLDLHAGPHVTVRIVAGNATRVFHGVTLRQQDFEPKGLLISFEEQG